LESVYYKLVVTLIGWTLDRSYEYDQAALLSLTYSGAEETAHAINVQYITQNGPYAQANFYDQFGNITGRIGWGAANYTFNASYTNIRRDGFTYDLVGNMTSDPSQTMTYDATRSAGDGQQQWLLSHRLQELPNLFSRAHVPCINIGPGFTYVLYNQEMTRCLVLVGNTTD
jgi:hypothetical protein